MSTLILLFVSSVQLGGFLFFLGEMCSIGGFRWSMVDCIYASLTGFPASFTFLLTTLSHLKDPLLRVGPNFIFDPSARVLLVPLKFPA
jgi:hypothetical protein